MFESEAVMAEDVFALLQRRLSEVRPRVGDIVTLGYWSEYREPDGTDVIGFVPGYMVEARKGPPDDSWVLLRLPDGRKLPFWARERKHEAPWLIISVASSAHGTFALTPA
jgi:hypothetical protein